MDKDIGTGLESQIFTWDGWDQNDVMCVQFYDVELIVPVGEFPIGYKFSCAALNGDNSSITFYDLDDEVGHTFELKVSVGARKND